VLALPSRLVRTLLPLLLALPLLFALLSVAACGRTPAPPETPPMKAPTPSPTPAAKEALATFGGGCFWCTEAVYLRLEGVLGVQSGYAGGHVENPTYAQVSDGDTGHAEVIQVRFDPTRIGFETLLKVFFQTHDPTTLNRQGADEGTQYRSIILAHDAEQERVAKQLIATLTQAKAFARPIVTEVTRYDRFYPAEAYHQDYFARNPNQGYCRAVVAPKVEKFEHAFEALLKKDGTGERGSGGK
jgi:methionine-S-sulfoxide reductase